MATSTWDTVELPILEAIRASELSGANAIQAARAAVPDLAETFDDVIVRLATDGWVNTTRGGAWAGGPGSLWELGLTGKGRRAIRQWPSEDALTSFTDLLSRMAASEPDTEKRKKLHVLLSTVKDLGTSVGVELFTAYLRQRGVP